MLEVLAFVGIVLLYFFIGALLDILSVIDLKAVQFKQAFRSAVVTFVSTMVSTYTYIYVAREPNSHAEVFAYALGGAVGTYYLLTKGYNEEGNEFKFVVDKRTKTGLRPLEQGKNKEKKSRNTKTKPIYRRSLVLARSYEGKGKWFGKVVIYRKQTRANASFL